MISPRRVADAERYYHLGRLYAESDQEKRAADAYRNAVDLARKLAKAQPSSGRVLIDLGTYLAASDKAEEAENIFRQAVKVAPGKWKCWAALGNHLLYRARGDWVEPDWKDRGGVGAKLLEFPRLPRKPSLEEVGRAEKMLVESGVCFDRAVAAAPGESRVYKLRVTARCSAAYTKSLLHSLRGEQVDPLAALSEAGVSRECVLDLQHISKLNPNDPEAVGAAVMVDACSHVPGARLDHALRLWESLPGKALPSVHNGMGRLKKLTMSERTSIAARAWEVLAFLQYCLLDDRPSATESCRRACPRYVARVGVGVV